MPCRVLFLQEMKKSLTSEVVTKRSALRSWIHLNEADLTRAAMTTQLYKVFIRETSVMWDVRAQVYS